MFGDFAPVTFLEPRLQKLVAAVATPLLAAVALKNPVVPLVPPAMVPLPARGSGAPAK